MSAPFVDKECPVGPLGSYTLRADFTVVCARAPEDLGDARGAVVVQTCEGKWEFVDEAALKVKVVFNECYTRTTFDDGGEEELSKRQPINPPKWNEMVWTDGSWDVTA